MYTPYAVPVGILELNGETVNLSSHGNYIVS
jgi:hypothetical protein